MKRTVIACLLALTAVSAHAWTYNSQQVGNTTYSNGYDGNGGYVNSTSQQIGNTTYTNSYGQDSQGNQIHQNCNSQRIGNSVYTNCY
ncbi:hypothetical protein [Paraburkholderia flagellata]|uniref:hypothetical protein n=1 Tax=Paraburkholderia flagellata TaxID=2883241 RepID=UPI001F3B1B66|nr:hypothetical protein [Paraburkholderia flagellata]